MDNQTGLHEFLFVRRPSKACAYMTAYLFAGVYIDNAILSYGWIDMTIITNSMIIKPRHILESINKVSRKDRYGLYLFTSGSNDDDFCHRLLAISKPAMISYFRPIGRP